MPELPEVETIARQLAPLVAGQQVRRLEIVDAKLASNGLKLLSKCRIRQVMRLGKQIVFELAGRKGRPLWLAVHLRMSGRLLWVPDAHRGSAEQRYVRARIVLDRGALVLDDPRRFAVLTVSRSSDDIAPAGLDPLCGELTSRRLAGLLGGSPQPLKLWLLRQDRLSGIGNIYASEILFAACLHPRRAAGSLSADEAARLHRAVRHVLRKATAHCGTTFSDFLDARGREGGFGRFLKVYGRGGQPCLSCGTLIEREVQGGRSTYFCPGCQR